MDGQTASGGLVSSLNNLNIHIHQACSKHVAKMSKYAIKINHYWTTLSAFVIIHIVAGLKSMSIVQCEYTHTHTHNRIKLPPRS